MASNQQLVASLMSQARERLVNRTQSNSEYDPTLDSYGANLLERFPQIRSRVDEVVKKPEPTLDINAAKEAYFQQDNPLIQTLAAVAPNSLDKIFDRQKSKRSTDIVY